MSLWQDLQRNRAVYQRMLDGDGADKQEEYLLPSQRLSKPANLSRMECDDSIKMQDGPVTQAERQTFPKAMYSNRQTVALTPLRMETGMQIGVAPPLSQADTFPFPAVRPATSETMETDWLTELERRLQSDARRFPQDFGAEEEID